MDISLSRIGGATAPARAVLAAMLDLTTARLAPALNRIFGDTRRVVLVEPDALMLYAVGRQGTATLLARLEPGQTAPERLRGGALEARLEPARFLRRTLAVPQAGRGYLGPIIEHRLERLTPWQPDKVLYGCKAAPAQPGAEDITVEILFTARDLVAGDLARVEAAGLKPTALGSAADPIAAPLEIDLYRSQGGSVDPRLRRLVGRSLAGAFALLIVACAALNWLANAAEDELLEVNVRTRALQSRLQARTASRMSREQALLEANRSEAGIGAFLDRMSASLPDHTVLRELDVNGRTVRLSGRSGDAPALVALLDGQAGLSGLRFAAPVVRDGQGRDLFDLAASRAPVTEASR